MNNIEGQHTVLFKSPYASLLNDLIALVLTFATAYAVTVFKETENHHIYSLINNRGPAQWFILYLIFRNISATMLAKRRAFLPDMHFRQAFAFSLFPFFIGLIGTVQGLGAAVSGFGHFLGNGAGTTDQIKSAVYEIFTGIGISLDTLFLGLLGTIMCLGLYVQALAGRIKHNGAMPEQTPNDYAGE